MPAQSGIAPSGDTLRQWQEQLNDPNVRLVKWAIDGEQVVSVGTWPSTAQEDTPADDALEADFGLFQQSGVVEDKTPAYFAFRLTPPPASTFAFLAYVPDHAPVRPKMLYASSTNTLVRALGDSRFAVRISAAEPNDLTYRSYLSTVNHDAAAAPLTAREAEMAEIKAAEASTADDADGSSAQAGRSIIFGHAEAEGAEGEEGGENGEIKGALPWTDEVKARVRDLGENGEVGACAILEIDIPKETVVLAAEQPTTLSVPPSSPCYLLYRHTAGLVLVYSCPAASPVKSRLLYSSAVLILYKRALPQWTGQTVLKKLETSDPSEITPAWIDSELGPLAISAATTPGADGAEGSAPSSGTATPKPESEIKFARPARPGRRR
ncbi:hypothetical protein JCM8202_005216 [Rhodotorula sphaerocarpa]